MKRSSACQEPAPSIAVTFLETRDERGVAIETHLAEVAVGGLVLSGRVHDDVHGCLSRNRRAETDGQKLDELRLHLGVHVQHLHVASTEATPGEHHDTTETPSC